jgi:hypothetical protein
MTKAQKFIKENEQNEELINHLFNYSFYEWDSDMVEDIYDLITNFKLIPNEHEAWEMAIALKDAFRNNEITFDYSVKVVI